MTKRKLSGGAAASPAKGAAAAEKKNVEQEEDPYAPGPIDVDPLKFLIAPKEVSAFTSENWERGPLHIPANEERKKFFDGLFSFDALAKVSDQLEAGTMLLMDQDPGPKGDSLSLDDDVDDLMIQTIGPLMFGRDVVAVRYIDGKRETIAGDVADSDTLRKLHNLAGATLQLHQPQRFINGLWRLVAALEAQAGCLVGCNAYVTPKNGQGLAPHHDDVELFVCQTQGSKKWRLYKPANGFELPSSSSGDLPQDGLGDPILEVTMQPGDVLYIPRGTVHQAVAQEEGSCHLTISTYQHWTWGDLAETVIETARSANGDQRFALPLELRKGLPLGLVFQHGLQAEVQAADPAAAASAARPAAAVLAAGLRALAAQLESGPLELLTPAVDSFALDFLRSRLPPHPCQLPEEGEEPELGDSLVCRGKNLFRLVPVELPGGGVSELDEDEDEDEEDKEEDKEGEKEGDKKEAHVKLVTCIYNNRYTHMISSSAAGVEDEESDEEDEEGGLNICGEDCGHEHGEGEEEEDEEEEKEEEEKEEEAAGKKGGKKKGGKKAAAEEEEAEKEAAKEEKEEEGGKKKGGKKGGKKAAAEQEGDTKKEEGDEPEIMEVSEEEDVELVAGEDEEGEGEESEESEEEDEEDDGLQGPIFPAQYAVVLADVLAASADRPLPIKQLRVPGGDAEEQLRLARLLYDFGAVIVVPGKKEAEEKGKAEAKGKAAEKGEDSAKKGKAAEKGEEKEGEKKGGKKGKAEEEVKGGSPPAKKAKKGAK